jgi:outer membrane receptor protein involved in Fe transport
MRMRERMPIAEASKNALMSVGERVRRLLRQGARPLTATSLAAILGTATLTNTLAAPPAEARSITHNLDIPSQSLGDALQALVLASQHKLLYSSEIVEGKVSVAIKGQYTTDEAVRQILSATDLAYEVMRDGLVIIEERGSREIRSTSGQSATRSISDEGSGSKGSKGTMRLSRADSQGSRSDEDTDEVKLEEIVVTAQKRMQRLQDVPISVSVLGGPELDKSSRSVIEELSRVAGVASVETRLGGGTQIAVRGVGSDTLFSGSSPISYYLDSVPFGLVESAIAPDANAYDLERVEVLRGPQGTLYGASAEGGLVRVLTNDANLHELQFKARTSVSSTEGGAGNYRGDIAANLPVITDKLAVRAVLGYEDRSGWIDSLAERRINDAQLRNYRLKLNAQPTDAFSVGLSAWSSRQDYGAPPSSLDGKTIPGRLPAPMTTDYDAYGLKLGYELPRVSITAMSSYLDYDNTGKLDLSVVGFGTPFSFALGSRMYSQELLLNSKADGPWRWSAGAFYRDGRDQTTQEALLAFGYLQVYEQRSKSSAVFGELGRRFHDDKLEWTVGLRYFHDDVGNTDKTPNATPYSPTQTFNATTPRVVLSWYPSDGITVYGSYSEGFRSGFPQNAEVGALYPDFPALAPDKLHSYEIGAKTYLLDRRFSIDAAAYFIDWKGVQQRLAVPAPGGGQLGLITALVNGASASGPGVDLALTARPFEGLELGLTASWNDLTLDEDVFQGNLLLFGKGDRLNGSHELTSSASADYVFPLGGGGYKGRFSASYNYTSDQTTQFIVADARLVLRGDAMRFVRASIGLDAPERWSLLLFADNINNEQGIAFMDNTPAFNIRPRPRTIGLQLEYRFE